MCGENLHTNAQVFLHLSKGEEKACNFISKEYSLTSFPISKVFAKPI
jgi:hypothetical protein